MKKIIRILELIFLLIILLCTRVNAHGGNITGWKDKNSDKITEHNGVYYGYHNQDGVPHYHQVEWNEQDGKWEIIKSAVYYDKNFNVINQVDNSKTKRIAVKYNASVDGDTAKFELDGKVITVRFLGIDTPETVHPNKGEEPYGKEASNFTKEKLENAQKIEIEYDENSEKTDKYERHLAWIWVDDSLLQEELVKNGLAQTYMLQDNYKYAGVLQESEYNAKKEKIKIWSNESVTSESSEKPEEIQEKTENQISTNEIISIVIGSIVLIVLAILKSKIKPTKKSKTRRRRKNR